MTAELVIAYGKRPSCDLRGGTDANGAPGVDKTLIRYRPRTHSLDANKMRFIRRELEDLADNKGDVEIDLRQVEFIDSSGVGCIVALLKRLKENGRELTLVEVKDQPKQLFKMLYLSFLIAQPGT